MSNPFNFFDKIYYINLDSRIDRKKKILKEFEIVGISNKVIRFPGVVYTGAYKTCPLAIGCTLSHRQILKSAINENLSNVLVFEDDCCFPEKEKTLGILANALSALKTVNWSIFYLGFTMLSPPTDIITKNLFKVSNNCPGAFALVYNKNIFTYLLTKSDELGIDFIFDQVIAQYLQKDFPCYGVYPMLGTMIADISDLSHKNTQGDGFGGYGLHSLYNKTVEDILNA